MHISTIGKKLSSNTSSRCPHNLVNLGPLAAEIGLPVWGTPLISTGFDLGYALLHGSQVVGVSQTLPCLLWPPQPNFATLNRGRHLHSEGRPSRWALAHISSSVFSCPISPAWHMSLTKEQTKSIEDINRRTLQVVGNIRMQRSMWHVVWLIDDLVYAIHCFDR